MRVKEFDNLFRQQLDRFETPADTDAAWGKISQRVSTGNRKAGGNNWSWGIVAATIGAIVLLGSWLGIKNDDAPETTAKIEISTPLPVEVAVAAPTTPAAQSPETSRSQIPTPPAPVTSETEDASDAQIPSTDIAALARQATILPCITLNKEIICSGEWVEVQTDNCTPGKEYLITWNDQPLRGNRHRLRMSREGENRLDLYAVENGKKKLLNRRNITVYPKRKTELVLDDNVNSELPTYHFMVKNNEAVAAIWKFENGAVVRDLHAGFMFSSKGRHRVKLTTINEHGCMDSTEQLVYIKHAYNLMASSIFNPLREKWMPAGLQKNDLPFELKIVNQEGNVIFVSRDAGDVWDGKWAENRIAVPGEIYYWVASIQDGKGSEYGGEILITAAE